MTYIWNETGAAIAEKLIAAHHPHLKKVKVAYLFKAKPQAAKPRKSKPKKKASRPGRMEIWAKASRVPAKYSELLKDDFEFVIEFDSAVWDRITVKQQEALVDHELCHLGHDIDGAYMRAHDVEEFRQIIERHGFWRDGLQEFAEARGPLFEGKPAAPPSELRKPRTSTRPLRPQDAV